MTNQLPASVEVWLGEKVGYSSEQKTFYFTHNEIQGSLCFAASGVWNVVVIFQKNIFKHVANRMLYSQRDQSHYYRLITRLIVQNLLFIKLQIHKSVSLISAAAVVMRDGAYVFAGLPGSGKTTTVKLLKKSFPDIVSVAQNYVLVEDGLLLSFPEGIEKVVLKPYPVKALFIVTHGREFVVEKLSAQQAYAEILAINHATAELPIHSLWSSMTMVIPEWQKLAFSEEPLRNLLPKIPTSYLCVDSRGKKFVDYFDQHYGQ
jgi:hypothetical protein